MQRKSWVAFAIVTGLVGCGSSSSTSNSIRDSGATGDAPATKADLGADTVSSNTSDVPAPDGTASTPDTTPIAELGPDSSAAVDTPALTNDDAPPAIDTNAAPDAAPGVDAPAPKDTGAQVDSAAVSTTGVVTSANSDDPVADSIVCATIKAKNVALTTDQALDIVMPDCLRLSGTVTLASPLPDGAVFSNGTVQAFNLERDANNKVVDTTTYHAQTTWVDATHFKYSVGVPAGTYDIMYTFIIKSSATMPSTASRIGQDRVALDKNTIHDVTLAALNLISSTVTVTGSTALPTNGIAYGRFVTVYGVNPSHTLLVSGMSLTVAASTAIPMWLPSETFTPTLQEYDSASTTAPYPSGYVSQFQLAPVAADTAITLALPAFAKISGTVADPNHVLSPMQLAGTSAPNYYQCNTLDYGTYPDPIFLFPEGSTSDFFSAATSHAFYARKGLTCVPYANYAVAVGAGGLPSRAGENSYAYMMDPTPKSPNAVTLDSDITRNLEVPALGAQITLHGTVKDARGNGLANINLSFEADTLTNPTLAEKSFIGGVDTTAAGAYTLHALPGTYFYTAELPTSDASSTNADAGVSKDATTDLPSSVTGDAGAYDCTTLAACCSTLSGSTRTGCNSIVATNNASTCSTYETILKMGGSCP